MQRPLTILLPVRNSQSTLADTLAQVLDTAADLSDRFQIMIIDDASTDATSEVAHELCKRYPQVRVWRHKRPLGEAAAVRLAAAQTRGEVVCVRAGRRPTFEPIVLPGEHEKKPVSADQAEVLPGKSEIAPFKAPPARPNFLDRAKTFLGEGVRQ